MCKADFIDDLKLTEEQIAKYIKAVLDDPDGIEGLTFNRWVADMKWLGIPIDWEEML